MMTQTRNDHEECWLQLPWLATGRLSPGERAAAEEHVRGCTACAAELERQRLVCAALREPERVTHAPGPSFRKLLERIDAAGAAPAPEPVPDLGAHRAARTRRLRPAAAWRPPGLAWAATFVFALGVGMLAPTFYRWSQPAYSTYTRAAPAPAGVLHIAFERSLAVGDVEQLLRAAGARIVEGPDRNGIFGVAPAEESTDAGAITPRMRALAARLGSDARVRWLQPLPATAAEPGADRTAAPH
ncbi:MAG: hypothetical protein JSR36_03495 [Proteobacteria bacterium]|nr:hypothetical protein [Pseudomonadota bacterium]